jgi:hypothetical protein
MQRRRLLTTAGLVVLSAPLILPRRAAAQVGQLFSGVGQVTTANPTPPASTVSFAMQGLCAGVALVVGVYSGNLLVTISGTIDDSTSAVVDDGITYQIAWGTGLGPANAAAATGTVVGLAQTYTNMVVPTAVADVNQPFSIQSLIKGVKTVASIWADLQAKSVTTASHVGFANVTVTAVEIN